MTRTLFVAILVVLAAVPPAAAISAAGSGSVTDYGTNHPLADSGTVESWNETGYVQGEMSPLQLNVSVSRNASAVGLSSWRISSTKTYLHIQYNESIERTVRFRLPAAYWEPQTVELDAEGDGPTLSLQASENRQYTTVTIHLSGETDAVYAVSKSRGTWAGIRSFTSGVLNATAGIDLPSLGGGDWQYVAEASLAGNETVVPIHTNDSSLTIQYDADPNPEAETWLAVQDCGDDDAPVCTFEKSGDSDTVYLLSKTSDPPTVRYKKGSAPLSSVTSFWSDAANAPDRLWDDISGLWGE